MTATSERNPYRPGVGTKPVFLAGRDLELRQFASTLRAAPEIPANARLTGLRGVGKTVLLNEFDDVARSATWATASLELEPRHNLEQTMVDALVGVATRAKQGISKTEMVKAKLGKTATGVGRVTVAYQDVSLTFDPGAGEREVDLARAMFEVTQLAASSGRSGFAVFLDEAQVLRDERDRAGEHPLSLLLAAVSAVQRPGLPLALVVCGLPTLKGNLLRARTYTERMFRGFEIGSLDSGAAREAFERPLQQTHVRADPMLVSRVLDAVEGYPYFIQLWGAELWDAASDAGLDQLTAELLDAIEPSIYRRLDTDFYEPRVETLTPAEQDVLTAASQCPYPPLRVADLQEGSEKSPGNVNVLLGRLVDAGVLFRLRKGEYEYTAPKFHEYLRRRYSHRPRRRRDQDPPTLGLA